MNALPMYGTGPVTTQYAMSPPSGGNRGRRVTDLVRVNGLDGDGRFVLHHLNASGDWI